MFCLLWRNFFKEWLAVFVSVDILFLRTECAEGLITALEFHWCKVLPQRTKSYLLAKESALARGTMIFRREVVGQFQRKLLLSLEIAKADREAIVVEPVKRKTSEFTVIWFKLIPNLGFNRKNLFSLNTAFPHGPFRSKANVHRLSQITWIRYHLIQ